MSNEVSTPAVVESTPAVAKVAKVKKSVKKVAPKSVGAKAVEAAKASPKKAAPKKSEAKSAKKSDGVIWSEPRIAIVNALKSLKATKAISARSAADIASKAGVEVADVKHYCYKNQQLVTSGLVAAAQVEDVAGLAYYLTADGAKAKY